MNENTSLYFPGVKLEEDPEDGGALLGLSKYRCPNCNAHLAKSGICLNTCHLSENQRAGFNKIMSKIVDNAT